MIYRLVEIMVGKCDWFVDGQPRTCDTKFYHYEAEDGSTAHRLERMEPRGIEPRFPACKAGVVPLDQGPQQYPRAKRT